RPANGSGRRITGSDETPRTTCSVAISRWVDLLSVLRLRRSRRTIVSCFVVLARAPCRSRASRALPLRSRPQVVSTRVRPSQGRLHLDELSQPGPGDTTAGRNSHAGVPNLGAPRTSFSRGDAGLGEGRGGTEV